MRTILRYSLVALAACLLITASAGVALAAGVATSVAVDGVVMVRIDEKHPDGLHLTLPLPAALVGAGLRLAESQAGEELESARAELAPFHSAFVGALDALAAAEDAVLVEVDDAGDHVLIRKRGSSLVIDVDSSDAEISVSVPLPLARRVVESLAV